MKMILRKKIINAEGNELCNKYFFSFVWVLPKTFLLDYLVAGNDFEAQKEGN